MMMTREQTKSLAVFVERLAHDLVARRISPDKVRFRIAHELAQRGLLTAPRHVARRFDPPSYPK